MSLGPVSKLGGSLAPSMLLRGEWKAGLKGPLGRLTGPWQGTSSKRLNLESCVQVLGGLALEGRLGLSMTTKQGPSGGETQAPHAEMESVILAEET